MPPSTFATVGPSLPNTGLSQTGPPLLGKDGKRGKEKDIKVEDEDVYSDPDDGVEIVDMDQVQKIDWMAPDILRKERRKDTKIKQEKLDDIGMWLQSLFCTTGLSSHIRSRSGSKPE
jgi:DNA-directed RNA polymerase III subunit RPC4